MAFVRIKKRKNAAGENVSYGYIVENKWVKKKSKGPRQKVKAYLGKVIPLDNPRSLQFQDVADGRALASKEDMISALTALELERHGFARKSERVYERDGISIDLKRKKISHGNADVCLHMHQGILSGYSLRQLHRFSSQGEEDGYRLAKLLVESGYNVDHETFVTLYNKIKGA